MDLALVIAKSEASRLFGLLFVQPNEIENDAVIAAVRQHFTQYCQKYGVEGILAVEWGNVVDRICDRTALLDLVVLCRDFHDEEQIHAHVNTMASQLELFIRRSCRPILLAAPEQRSLPRHALLVYDDEPQSQEALFLAAYVAEQWQTQLTVLTPSHRRSGNRSGRPDSEQYARQYLTLHEIEAVFYQPEIKATEATEHIYQAAAAQACDLIIIGGYPRKGGYRRSSNSPRAPLLNYLLANWSRTLLISP
jgi:hypothetical protein